MTEQTNLEKLTLGIEKDLAVQIRTSMLKLLLKTSDKTTFADLVKLTESPKYGSVATSITLQELLDAHVEAEGFVPEGTVEAPSDEADVKAPRKRKKATSTEEVEVSLRTDDEKAAYRAAVAEVIKGKDGGDTTSKEIMLACGGTQPQIRGALRELVLERRIVQNGRARATRYFWRADASEEVLEKYEAFLGELKPEKRAEFDGTLGTDPELVPIPGLEDAETDSASDEDSESDSESADTVAELEGMDV